MSKLEEVMGRRASAEKRSAAASLVAERKREERAARQRRVFERKEFNRLFKRLKTLVDGRWDRYGWGWKFSYKGDDYYVDYQDWYSPKSPGDADGYDMSGTCWVLKRGFNGIQGNTVTLSTDREPKQGLTEAVLRGLRELSQED